MQEDKTPKRVWGQIKNAFEFADLANKNTGYSVEFEFHINKYFFFSVV